MTYALMLFMICSYQISAWRPMFLVRNEQTKLSAALLNALATALVAAGFFAPLAASLLGITQAAISYWIMTAVAVGCAVLAGGLHVLGRALLRRLRE